MATDKQLHVLCGYSITLTVALYNIYIGLACGLVAGLAKELYDYLHPQEHTVDVWDVVYTWAGAAIAFAICFATK